MPIDGLRPGVEGGERIHLVAAEFAEQIPEVSNAAANVLRGVADVGDAIGPRRFRHQLHRAERALGRRLISPRPALRVHDADDEIRLDTLAISDFPREPLDLRRRHGGRCTGSRKSADPRFALPCMSE